VGGSPAGRSVGAAGGWLLGGGHGALSPNYGLGNVTSIKLKRNASSIPFLLSSPAAVKHLLTFIHSTGRFKDYTLPDDRPMTNARRNAELIAGAKELGLL
jgi:hypothetical protein